MKTLKVEKDIISELIIEENDEDEEYVRIAVEYLGDWRWGTQNRLVIQDKAKNFWAIEYQEQSGDNYWISLDDEVDENGKVELYEVVPQETVITVYRRPNV